MATDTVIQTHHLQEEARSIRLIRATQRVRKEDISKPASLTSYVFSTARYIYLGSLRKRTVSSIFRTRWARSASAESELVERIFTEGISAKIRSWVSS